VAESSIAPHESWFLDSGATTHVTPDLNCLSSSQPYTGTDVVHMGNGTCLKISHIGSTILSTSGQPLVLTNVLHVPLITKKLLSIQQLTQDNNVLIEFTSTSCFIKDKHTRRTILTGILTNGLYALDTDVSSSRSIPYALQASHLSADIWHSRLMHCSSSLVSTIRRINDIPMSPTTSTFYSHCSKVKAHKLPFQPSTATTTAPLQVIHTNLWGPSPISSHNGYRFYVHFTDEYNIFSWFYSCASKSDVVMIFSLFKAKVENLLSTTIKTVQCDNETEFKPLISQYPAIHFQFSCPYTPKQNDLAERKHRHIVELGLATMSQASIPLHYWDEVFQSVVFVINRLSSSVISMTTPFELLFLQKPDYSFFQNNWL
jgi:hypothetical protein